jgi:hypothetical protein
MFAGHVGAGLALGSLERRVNVAVFVGAALLLDLVLWVLVLLGVEHATIPSDMVSTHQPAFDFPWSHGLVSALAWSALAGLAARALAGARLGAARARLAWLVAAAVFSHWLLDAWMHRPELPLLGDAGPKVGLGWWDHPALGVGAELAVTVAGLWACLAGGGWTRARGGALAIVALLLLAISVAGLTIAPPPPSVGAMAVSSLTTLVIACAVLAWLDRRGRRIPGDRSS